MKNFGAQAKVGATLIALAMGTAIPTRASAQDPPRIPITKDRGMRDTVMRDTVDATLIRVRVDTVNVDRIVMQVDTVTLYDTMTVTREVPAPFARNRFYWGLGAGAAVPGDGLDEGFDTGFNATLLGGWRSDMSPWGLRLEAAYNQFSGTTIGTVDFDEASAWSAVADATFEIPWGDQRRSGFYLLGGVGIHGISGFDLDEEDVDELLDRDVISDEDEIITGSTTDFGVNAGAGLRFGVGGASLFVESRWVNVFTSGNDTRYIPIVLGVTF